MTMSLAPITELDAVNRILEAIGEGPVNNLSDPNDYEVSKARAKLEEFNRRVQTTGWFVNEDLEYTFAVDGNGRVPYPNTVHRARVVRPYRRLVQRAGYFYDIETHTDILNEEVVANVVWCLDFSDLPPALRDYITIAAARSFQRAMQGDQTMEMYNTEELNAAMASAMQERLDARDDVVFDDPVTLGMVYTWRNR